MKKSFLLLIISVFLFSFSVSAQSNDDILQAYKEFKVVEGLDIKIPTVVEVLFNSDYLENKNFAVLEVGDDFQPNYFYNSSKNIAIGGLANISIFSNHQKGINQYLIDENNKTFTEYSLPDNGNGSTKIVIKGNKSITSSSLVIQLDNYVALPTSIKITTQEGARENIVLAKSKMRGRRVYFPKTTASTWNIYLEYSQPLRITELELRQEVLKQREITSGLRFLARPGMDYKIYFNPDRIPNITVSESGNLRNPEEVLKINPVNKNNPTYIKADIDKDGVPDEIDNCVKTPNPKQTDINNNKRGDACDDFDLDGVINSKDNCPDKPNSAQSDIDNDQIGDACDNQESRITENKPWLPWVGMGLVAIIVGVLLVTTIRKK
ncbi:hypothetical protein HOD96_04385 [Candidatus Falkowbacteria bacterium]|jgi:hypothetical protein|nr:hypothetical protein [Candidatus Falkowbacteria bacterium]MBT4433486.1 hypothetical protein [Candidatus Falkowbacteria bacterium]